MKVVLDARKLGDGGIGVYLENLVEGIISIASNQDRPPVLALLVQPKHFALLQPKQQDSELRALLHRWGESVQFYEESSGKYSLSEYFTLARHHRDILDVGTVYHSPHYTLPYGLGVPSVITVHDVIHIEQPESVAQRVIGGHLIRSAVRRADHIITVSSASLARLTSALGQLDTPVSVIHNGVSRAIGVIPAATVRTRLKELGRDKQYYLFVGSDRPHKNFHNLLRGFAAAMLKFREQGFAQPELVAVGTRYSSATLRMVHELGLKDAVRFVGGVGAEELAVLYNGALGVLVPSLIEGFGLVALEGLASGRPVICSPEASFKEVCGNSAWYAEDFSPSGLADVIVASVLNSEMREQKVQAGLERAKLFTREAAAQLHLGVYAEAAEHYVLERAKGGAVVPYRISPSSETQHRGISSER